MGGEASFARVSGLGNHEQSPMEEAGLYLAVAWIAARLLPLTTDQGLGIGSEWHMTPLDHGMKLEELRSVRSTDLSSTGEPDESPSFLIGVPSGGTE